MAAELQQIKSRMGELQALRSSWEAHAQEIVNYIMPYHEDIISPESRPEGKKNMELVYDSTANHACLMCANKMSSLMANAAMDWFRVGCADRRLEKDKQVKLWLEGVGEVFQYIFNKSNFYTTDHKDYIDHTMLGSGCMFIGEHERWLAYYDSMNLAECFPAMNQYGQVDTLYRRFQMSARNLVAKFGRDQVSEAVRKEVKDRPDTRYWLIHAVEPRPEREAGKMDKGNLPWTDIYLEEQSGHKLREGGFREFPYVFTRQFVASGQTWGWGLGMVALPDVKELQQKRRDILLAGEKKLFPPMLLPNDGFITMPIKLTRNGVNFINADGNMQEKIGVFPVPQDLGYTEADMEGTRQRIREDFYNTLLTFTEDQEMTLGQFLRIAKEKAEILGPYVGRLFNEHYNPIFDRTFSLAWEAGAIEPPPPILMRTGGQLRIEYISQMALAQKLSANQGILQLAGFVGQVAQFSREAVMVVPWGRAVREMGENLGVSVELLRDDKEIAALLAAEEKKLQEEKAQAAALELAGKMGALSKGPEAGSPVDMITQGLRQGAGNA